MCGKLKPGNCVVSAVVSEEVKKYLVMAVKDGGFKTLSEAAGTMLTEAMEERISKGESPNPRQDQDNEFSDKSMDNPGIDGETFNRMPKTYQIFSKLLEEANKE